MRAGGGVRARVRSGFGAVFFLLSLGVHANLYIRARGAESGTVNSLADLLLRLSMALRQ